MMQSLLLTIRLVLGLVFAVAAVAKLWDIRGSRAAVEDFGVPPSLSGFLAIAIPLAELSTFLMLLLPATAWWGSIAALGLLILFLGVIGISLVKGRTPACHCFGQLYSRPVSRSTMVRTGVLALCALFLIVLGPGSLGASLVWMGMWTLRWPLFAAITLAALLLQSWLLFHLMRQQGRLLLRLDTLEQHVDARRATAQSAVQQGLPPGTRAPDFELPGASGDVVSLRNLLQPGLPLLLLFSDPACGPCKQLEPQISDWQRAYDGRLGIVVLSKRSEGRNSSGTRSLRNVLLQEQREVADLYHAYGTPSAVLIRPDGTIGSPVVGGADAIQGLLEAKVGNQHIKLFEQRSFSTESLALR